MPDNKPRRQRGPGKPKSERFARLLDRQIQSILTNGENVVDARGQIVRDGNGDPVFKNPSAAMLAQIRQRINEIRKEEKESPQNNAIEAARERMKAARRARIAERSDGDGEG